jgi:hypothetical protein
MMLSPSEHALTLKFKLLAQKREQKASSSRAEEPKTISGRKQAQKIALPDFLFRSSSTEQQKESKVPQDVRGPAVVVHQESIPLSVETQQQQKQKQLSARERAIRVGIIARPNFV